MTPPPPPGFHLRCTAICPVAQRAMIALAERGTPWTVETVREGQPAAPDRDRNAIPPGLPLLTVTGPQQAGLHLTETFAMIELIEDLHPGHPLYPSDPWLRAAQRNMMETGRQIQHHLSAATRAREQNELDMIVHRMQTPLMHAEAQAKGGRPGGESRLTNVDVVFAPTLWRLHALDKAFRTFFLRGCPALAAWAERLQGHPAPRMVLPDSLVPVYLEGVARRGAIIADQGHSGAWAELSTRTTRVAGMG